MSRPFKVALSVLLLMVGLLAAAPVVMAQSHEETSLWDAIKGSTVPDDYKAYLDKYPDGVYAPLAKRRIAALEAQAAPAATAAPPVSAGAAAPGNASSTPVTMTECEGANDCATWTFLGKQGNGQWPSGETATLSVDYFDANSVVIRRADAVGPSAGLTATYRGTRHGDRIGGQFTSSWPGHWTNMSGNWSATIGKSSQTLPSEIRVCDPARCGTWLWDNGHYDGLWADIPLTSTITVESFTPESVVFHRANNADSNQYLYRGTISADGNSIIDGLVSGLNNNQVGRFSAYWGTALKDHPASGPAQRQQSGMVVAPVVCFPWFFSVVCQ
jgi:hypothetical protein